MKNGSIEPVFLVEMKKVIPELSEQFFELSDV